MKKIWLLLALVIVVSCENDSTLNFVILSGKVTNSRSKEITIKGIDNAVNESIKLLEDGSFIDTLYVSNGVYMLNYGRNRAQLYFEGGNNLTVNFDAKDFENTLTFLGDGSGESAYVFAKGKKIKEAKIDDMKVYEMPEKEFKDFLKEVNKSLETILNSTDGVSRSFKTKEERNLNYAYINKLENYKVYHSFLTKNPEYKVSEDFLKEVKDVKYDNEEDFLFSSEYRNLLLGYYRKQSFENLKDKATSVELSFINTVSTISNETIKNGLLFNYANTMFNRAKEKDSFYKAFLAASTNEENNKIITELYNKYEIISEGKPSPIFSDYEKMDGSKVSLGDLKGKFVYIYVWSSSFSPSIEQIKSFNELQNKYSSKNIEFVALSIDRISNKDGWKEAVIKEGFKGLHIIADKGKDSDFIKNYAILFPPRFIFIDKDGNIIDADAPRPSDLKLEKLFNKQNI